MERALSSPLSTSGHASSCALLDSTSGNPVGAPTTKEVNWTPSAGRLLHPEIQDDGNAEKKVRHSRNVTASMAYPLSFATSVLRIPRDDLY